MSGVGPPPVPHSRPWITAEDEAAVARCLRSSQIARGTEVAAFEADLADLIGARHALTTSSGTQALWLALDALGVRPGDEVVVPTYVCEAVAAAVRQCGGTPRLVDVAPGWRADACAVAAALGPRTRAIVLVHALGVYTDPSPFLALGPPVVEDFCQTFAPARFPPRGAAAVYSFHATKCLTTGEGGLLTTDDDAVAARARARSEVTGGLSDLQAALGRAQLARQPAFAARRAAIAEHYLEALPRRLTTDYDAVRRDSMGFRFLLTGIDFDTLRRVAGARGVAVRRGVDALLHRRAGLDDAPFPVAADLLARTCSIPAHPSLGAPEVTRVIEAVRAALEAGA